MSSVSTFTGSERFIGFIDEIRDGKAFITLTGENGAVMHEERDAAQLIASGISERRSFVLEAVYSETFTPSPETRMTKAEIAELHAELGELCNVELDGDD
jgi:hypothetical protein